MTNQLSNIKQLSNFMFVFQKRQDIIILKVKDKNLIEKMTFIILINYHLFCCTITQNWFKISD